MSTTTPTTEACTRERSDAGQTLEQGPRAPDCRVGGTAQSALWPCKVPCTIPFHSSSQAVQSRCGVAAGSLRGRCGVAAEGRPLLVLQLASGASYP